MSETYNDIRIQIDNGRERCYTLSYIYLGSDIIIITVPTSYIYGICYVSWRECVSVVMCENLLIQNDEIVVFISIMQPQVYIFEHIIIRI